MTISIREYTKADNAQVIALVRELQRHEAQFFDRMKEPEEIGDWYVRDILQACAEHQGAILLAETDGGVVGYAAVLTAVSSRGMIDEISYAYAMVLDLVVASSVRRQGVGRKLLAACETHARNAGVRWLRISVLAGNSDAVATYENFGFHPHLLTMEKPL